MAKLRFQRLATARKSCGLNGQTITNSATSSRSDLRTTIHWEPDLRVETGEKTIIRFYAADATSTYDLIIEGITDAGEPINQRIELRVSE